MKYKQAFYKAYHLTSKEKSWVCQKHLAYGISCARALRKSCSSYANHLTGVVLTSRHWESRKLWNIAQDCRNTWIDSSTDSKRELEEFLIRAKKSRLPSQRELSKQPETKKSNYWCSRNRNSSLKKQKCYYSGKSAIRLENTTHGKWSHIRMIIVIGGQRKVPCPKF